MKKENVEKIDLPLPGRRIYYLSGDCRIYDSCGTRLQLCRVQPTDEPKISRVTGTLEFAEKTSAVVIMPLGDTLPEPLRTK